MEIEQKNVKTWRCSFVAPRQVVTGMSLLKVSVIIQMHSMNIGIAVEADYDA